MKTLAGNHVPKPESNTAPEGINMAALCRTLARVLVLLEETGYSDGQQQDTVLDHDALPDPASGMNTHEA
ncbi:MAG: hypothetical protein K8F30_10740 [Taibaiella sp.]|nr:hypothetical protein [Taibaiella sp.]